MKWPQGYYPYRGYSIAKVLQFPINYAVLSSFFPPGHLAHMAQSHASLHRSLRTRDDGFPISHLDSFFSAN